MIEKDLLFDKTEECLNCQVKFKSKQFKSKQLKVKNEDYDLKENYEDGFEPLKYTALVCPNCGFAFTTSFRRMSPVLLGHVQENYLNKVNLTNIHLYQEERDLLLGIDSMMKAFYCAELSKQKPIVLGNMALKIAWLYRTLGDKEKEHLFLNRMASLFEETFDTDSFLQNPHALAYILANTYYELDIKDKSKKWFLYLLNNREIPASFKKKIQDRWLDVKGTLK